MPLLGLLLWLSLSAVASGRTSVRTNDVLRLLPRPMPVAEH